VDQQSTAASPNSKARRSFTFRNAVRRLLPCGLPAVFQGQPFRGVVA
jgi:hypothetical protein